MLDVDSNSHLELSHQLRKGKCLPEFDLYNNYGWHATAKKLLQVKWFVAVRKLL